MFAGTTTVLWPASDGDSGVFAHSALAVKSVPLRQQYINEVRALEDVGLNVRAAGQTTEDAARMLQQMHRELGIKYKDMTPADELARIATPAVTMQVAMPATTVEQATYAHSRFRASRLR